MGAAFLFVLEAAIAVFVHDQLVRPYLGDSLAVVLVYCGLRAVTLLRAGPAIAAALAIAFAVEFGQWIGYVDRLGLRHFRIARIVLGTGFDPRDFIAYTGGAAAIALVETVRQHVRMN